MIIAWDGRALVGSRTGIGWYTHHLIRGFVSLEESSQLGGSLPPHPNPPPQGGREHLSPSPLAGEGWGGGEWRADLYLNKPIADQFSDLVTPCVVPYPNTVRLRSFWENLLLPLLLKCYPPDVWHSPLSVIPKGLKCKTVATIHDLAFLHFPGILPPAYRKYWTTRIAGACERADRLIAVSRTTQEDLHHWFNVEDERITVIHEAADSFYHTSPSLAEIVSVKSRLDLKGSFFLFVGTLEPRKNLAFLLEVYQLLQQRIPNPPPLLIIGGKGWLQPDLESRIESFQGRVRLLGYVERRDLRALYRCARLVFIPSKYEGFGLQAAEAMACGAVVIASKVSSLPEVVGEGGVLLPIDAPEVWVDKILELSENEAELGRMRDKAVRQAARFSWLRTARETFDVYKGVMGS